MNLGRVVGDGANKLGGGGGFGCASSL